MYTIIIKLYLLRRKTHGFIYSLCITLGINATGGMTLINCTSNDLSEHENRRINIPLLMPYFHQYDFMKKMDDTSLFTIQIAIRYIT